MWVRNVFFVVVLLVGIFISSTCFGDFALLGKDPDEVFLGNINQVFADSDANKIYFKFTTYGKWSKDVEFDVGIDADQNTRTGNESGIDYVAWLYMEDGSIFGGLDVYDPYFGDFFPTNASLYDVVFAPNSDFIQFSVLLKDIGNPSALNLSVMVLLIDLVDIAPDTGFYTYKLTGQAPGGTPSITASPAAVKPGDTITVSFSNAPGNATDWIGMYNVSAKDDVFVEAYYLEGYKNGTLPFKAPDAAGDYNFRMFPNDQYVPRLAVSNTVTVGSGTVIPGQATISASPAAVKPGDSIIVSYSGAPGNANDWIGIYKVDATDRQYISYQYLGGNKNGTLTFQAPNEVGNYNFRMFPNNAYEPRLALSNTVAVTATGQPGGNESAVQKAMAWLAKQQKADGHFCDGYILAATAVAVQAFEEKGHLPGQGQQYSSIVEKGLDFIFSKAVIKDISAQKAGNPDSDGDGKGVYFVNDNKYAYETGICLLTIYASKSPNRRVNTGPCAGWTYLEVVRDVVDYLAFAQDEDKGGWRYDPNSGSDNSASQWPAFGLIYAEQLGMVAPGWMKSELNRWVNYVQNTKNGGSGYQSPDELSMSTIGRTGGMLIQMYYLGDRANSARVQKAISFIDNKTEWASGNNKGKAYATFSIYKGLRLMDVKSLPTAVEGGDWYTDYVQWLLKNQHADGYWNDEYGTCLATGWYIMMLEDVVKPLPTVTPQQPNVTLPADGTSNTGVTVSVNDPQGNPLPGQTVTGTVSPPGGGTMGPIKDNGNGTYTGTFTAGNTPGQVVITISVTNIGISTTINITLIVPGSGPTTTVTQGPPATMPANGTSSTSITITIKNPQGQPLPGQTVTTTVSPPDGGTVGPIKDNGNGTYTGTFTAGTKPGNVTITINVTGGASTSVGVTLTPPGAAGRMLVIPEVTGTPGQDVTVPINITDASGVAGADINVLYNSNILKIKDAKITALSAGLNLEKNFNILGKVILRIAGSAIASGSGAFIDMIFTINASAALGTETPVTFESAEVYDANGLNIAIGTQNGKVKIGADCVKGDVNGDGSIKSNDAILALRIAAQLMEPTAQQFCAADYNSDNAVKSNDAILILRKSAGLIAPSRELVAASDRYITITLDEVYGEAGKSIDVPVKVDNTDALAGGDFCVAYDKSVLRAVEVSPVADILLAGNVSEPGIVRIAFACPDRLNSETLVSIKFDVTANNVSPLSLQNFELYGHDALLLTSNPIDKDFISYLSRPKYSALLQNFPNPFNPDTWIPYQLKEDCEVTIWILNTKGEIVRKLDLGRRSAGLYINQDRAAYWDGKDNLGIPVASGVYFYSIQAGNLSAVKKMIVLK